MLTYVIKMTGFFSWIARQSAEMENGVSLWSFFLNLFNNVLIIWFLSDEVDLQCIFIFRLQEYWKKILKLNHKFQMVSIERIVKYTELEPEKEPLITAKLDSEWPQHGRIQANK